MLREGIDYRCFTYRGFDCDISVYPNLSSYTIFWPDGDVLKRGKIIADSWDEVDDMVRNEIDALRDWWVRKQHERREEN